jgi:hypothetical protein
MSADKRALAAAADEVDGMAMLPPVLVLKIFSGFPADERARCATVRRSWRTAVSDHNLWTRLDLSVTSGVTCTVNDSALVAAAARAGGQLEALDLTGRNVGDLTLLWIATANSATLRELRVGDAHVEYHRRVAEIESLLRAAPHLRVLETDAFVEAAHAGRLLHNKPPFGPLRLHKLSLLEFHELRHDIDSVLALAAGVVAHAAPLASLCLDDAPFHNQAVLDSVVDAVLARRVRCVSFGGEWMGLSPESVPALARLLLGGDALQELELCCGQTDHLLDEHAATLLGAAFRDNSTLTSLKLDNVLNHNDDAVVTLLRALKAHPSLRKLWLTNTRFPDEDHETFHALGDLVAANAPALHELSVRLCSLQDEGLGPLVDALRANTHLRVLDCGANGMTSTFARCRLVPAVRANRGLRQLITGTDSYEEELLDDGDVAPETEMARARQFQAEARALVDARGGGGGAVFYGAAMTATLLARARTALPLTQHAADAAQPQ